MLRTNSRKAMENTFEGREAKTDFNEICADILEMFRIEKLENNRYYIAGRASKSEMFMDWMQGLPTAFPVADDIFLRSAIDFLGNILEETEEEKARYTEDKAEKLACSLLYRELEKGARK